MSLGLMYRNLLLFAEQEREHSYCKYSKFSVGVSLLTESKDIYVGCNIENSSFPAGICAERVAFGNAIADGHRKFRAMAIAGAPVQQEDGLFCPPCGLCLQFISEFCDDDFDIILADREAHKLKEFLPVRFSLE